MIPYCACIMISHNYLRPCYVLLLVAILALNSCMVLGKNHAPEQVRLQLTGVPGEYMITYTTGSSSSPDGTPKNAPESWCMYGVSEEALSEQIQGTSNKYEYKDYSAYIHQVKLTELVNGQTYYYQLGDSTKTTGLSKVFSFTAGNVKTWAIYGDYGSEFISKSLQSLTENTGTQFQGVIHVGDLAYDLHDDNGGRGDVFLRGIEPVAAQVPYHITPGNHEKKGNFSHYGNRFAALGELGKNSASDTHLWYSWNQELVHFIAIDTEVYAYHYDAAQVERQLKWLEFDLKKYNTPALREKYPWIVMLGHKCDWQENVDFSKFQALAEKYGVDVHICGHQHNYQRLYPGLGTNVETQHSEHLYTNPRHWTQIVVGSPGCEATISSQLCTYPDALAHYELAYGYGLLTVHNRTHLEWQWYMTNQPASHKGGSVFDQAMLAMRGSVGHKGDIADYVMIVQDNHGPK